MMELLIAVGACFVLWLGYEVYTAPTIHPDSCYDVKVRNGRLKCKGPCVRRGPLPCEPVSKVEART